MTEKTPLLLDPDTIDEQLQGSLTPKSRRNYLRNYSRESEKRPSTKKQPVPKCLGKTIYGHPCKHDAVTNTGYCRHHDPENLCTFTDSSTGQQCEHPRARNSTYCSYHDKQLRKAVVRASKRTQILAEQKVGETDVYITHMPPELADAYTKMQADSRLLSLRGDIALSRVRTTELIEELNTTRVNHADLRHHLRSLRVALDEEGVADEKGNVWESLTTLERIAMAGMGHKAAWEEITVLAEQRRRLIESERRQLEIDGAMIPLDQVIGWLQHLFAIQSKLIPDQQLLNEIQYEYSRFAVVEQGRIAYSFSDAGDGEPAGA